jgi:thiamine-monophosphate kinase
MLKLNEKEIIAIFQKKLGNKKFVPDDVDVFRIGKINFVTKVDTLVESTDIPLGMKLEDAARKSVVACISDFAAKGVKPLFGLTSVTIPKKFSKSKIISLAKGLGKAAKEFDLRLIGGDTNEGRELVIQISLFGTTKKIVKRGGAKINDIIITTGPFGYSFAGLKILLEYKKATTEFSKKAKKTVFNPMPKLKFGLINQKFFSSSMDSSDGLSTTLNEMSKQSKKKFVITKLPANQDLFEFAMSNRLDAVDLIFNGGEEYEMVATVNPTNLSKIRTSARALKIPLFELGYVKSGVGVVYKTNSKIIQIKDKGWLHFRS